MRIAAKLLFVIASMSGAAIPAFAGPLLVNGNFETGDFSGWTKSVQSGSAGDAFVVANIVGGTSPLSNFPYPQNSTGGNYFALTDQTNPGSYVLTQSFTLSEASAIIVSFDLLVDNQADSAAATPPERDYTAVPNQNVVVDILRAGADAFTTNPADIIAVLYGPGGTGLNAWASYGFDLGPLAAGTYQFRFGETDNQSFFQAGLDNVEVIGYTSRGDVPEPATLGLIGAGLAGMLRTRRQRRKAH
jgi:hypothetical protein